MGERAASPGSNVSILLAVFHQTSQEYFKLPKILDKVLGVMIILCAFIKRQKYETIPANDYHGPLDMSAGWHHIWAVTEANEGTA